MKLEDEYYKLTKRKSRQSEKEKENREKFTEKISRLFWIGKADIRDTIQKDKNRSESDKNEDLSFLEDQLGKREQKLGQKVCSEKL